MSFEDFVSTIEAISDYADKNLNETLVGFVCAGSCSNEIIPLLQKIKGYVVVDNIDNLRLTIDGLPEEWNSIDFNEPFTDWQISISKKNVLEAFGLLSPDASVALFFSYDYFYKDWLPNSTALENLEADSFFCKKTHHKIFVNKLAEAFGGPRIAVVPISEWQLELPHGWMKSTKLPDGARIRKSVHFLTDTMPVIDPENFLITWGCINQDPVRYFNHTAVSSMLMALVQEYYGPEKVVLNGTRRIEAKLLNGSLVKEFSASNVNKLREIIEWCYLEEDEKTRILLIVDRLTLDFDGSGCLVDVDFSHLENALYEARSRYKYVVLDRKSDYSKELADIQKDISSVVEKYSSSINGFVSGLLRDFLALGFVLTIGVISKKFAQEDLLFSSQAGLLFKAFSIYLILAVIMRCWHMLSMVSQGKSFFMRWRNITRSHMSEGELKRYIDDSLIPVELNFYIMAGATVLLYVAMIFIAWHLHSVLKIFGVS